MFLNKKVNSLIYRLFGIISVVVLISSCSNAVIDKSKSFHSLENFNRTMFYFNYNVLDYHLIRPIAITWRNYMPMPIRNGLINFFSNIEESSSMVNNFLCGNVHQGMKNFNRFFLNSIFGMGGFIDVASMANSNLSKKKSYRFGSTLGYYQIGYGPYIVLPGYGNFTLREDFGDLVDTVYPMLSYLTFWTSILKWILEGIEKRALFLDFDGILQNSLDPYLMMKEAYFQYKQFSLKENEIRSSLNLYPDFIEKELDSID
ncbi:MlaA family lipoprotein [Arsenophonus symbiont of Ornithomya chloropus]|uniref:MlaA family lipoprotein n=1 Tax=Arsenophonus symbiont of Ornithomya chloropus TaxID=634121 RepID=UPI0032B2FFC2